MAAVKNSDCHQPKLWAIGPIPPPVTGMTLLTERVLQRLQQAGPLKVCNWSHGRQTTTPYAHAIRVLRTLGCVGKLLLNGRARNKPLYLVANSRSGLLLTVVLVFVARQLRYRVYLHHHTYGYINRYNRWMSWIDRHLAPTGVHVVHCNQMVQDFRRQYASNCHFETIFPSVVSIDVGQPRLAPNKPFRLGMLSNLTIDKGLDLAINTFRALHESGAPVSLALAGPIRTPAAKTLIDEAVKSFPDLVRYVGPVYGNAKRQFLQNIDALIFPTRYNEESWGIVLNEAFAAGAPVITFDRGCTKTVVGAKAGLVVDQDANFAQIAGNLIRQWINDESAYRSASQAAIDQAEFLSTEGNRMLDDFAERIFSER